MLNNLNPQKAKYQDGSSRGQSAPEFLLTDMLNFEQREIEDWLRFAEEYSHLLHYYDDSNHKAGFWNGFLQEDLNGQKFPVNAKNESLNNFRYLLAEYVKGHVPVNAEMELRHKLQAPHRTLFLTFLELLEEIKEQFNKLPKRHLDFHFRELLQFKTLPAVADEAHVQILAAEDTEQITLEEGTIFIANQYEENEVKYRMDHLMPVNQIDIHSINQIYLEKRIETITSILKNNISDPDGGFQKLIEFTLVKDFPGTNLQPIPGVEISESLESAFDTFHELFQSAVKEQKDTKAYWDYLEKSLFMTFEDFDHLTRTQKRKRSGLPEYPGAWIQVYDILRKSYRIKKSTLQKTKLRQAYEDAKVNGESGIEAILRRAFADKETGLFPQYNNAAFDFYTFQSNISGAENTIEFDRASDYIKSEWLMTVIDFRKVQKTLGLEGEIEERKWAEALNILEAAMRLLHSSKAGKPQQTEPEQTYIGRLGALEIDLDSIKSLSENDTHQSLPLFGDKNIPEAILGWQFQSPLFTLSEGEREVLCYLRLTGENPNELSRFFGEFATNNTKSFLNVFWQLDEEIQEVSTVSNLYGNYILDKPIQKIIKKIIETREGQVFFQAVSDTFDVSKNKDYLILMPDNRLFKIIKVDGVRTAELQFLTTFSEKDTEDFDLALSENECWLFTPDAIYYHSLQVKINLDVEFPALTKTIQGGWPILHLDLNQNFIPNEIEPTEWNGVQHALRSYHLDCVKIQVKAHDIEIKAIGNDNYSLDYKTPYFPFGDPCKYGNSFYFSHEEIASKPVKLLDLKFEWPQIPQSFTAYYEPYYSHLAEDNPAHPNASYNARLSFKDRFRTSVITENVALFSPESTPDHEQHQVQINFSEQMTKKVENYRSSYYEIEPKGNILDWDRYFIFEYTGSSFLEEEYQLAQISFFADPKTGKVPIPYVPKLKKLTASYTSEEVLFGSPENETLTQMSYKVPFGTVPIQLHRNQQKPLLYPYNNSGELYFGLKNAKHGDSISILFQLANGTAQADLKKPAISWHYFSKSGWENLPLENQLSDHTDNFTKTGIKIIQLPTDCANNCMELGKDLFWIKAVTENYSEGTPNFVGILSGVAHVVQFGEVPDQHFTRLLPVNSITELEISRPTIKEIIQPYTSTKGMAPENPEDFYYRVSKRLRHKNRALTMWDYEQLVLQNFPNVYKVKCLSSDHLASASPGDVRIIVIPDVRGQVPFTPLQPKFAAYELEEIKEYLSQYSPPYATLSVNYPDYLPIRVRLGVRLMAGYPTKESVKKIMESIRQFLSPWAYDTQHEISFGGEVYANALIGYLENLPFVDYITNIKLFRLNKEGQFKEVFIENGVLKIMADSSVTVLVSDEKHDIDVIGDEGYVVGSFSGINFDKVELDFRVGD